MEIHQISEIKMFTKTTLFSIYIKENVQKSIHTYFIAPFLSSVDCDDYNSYSVNKMNVICLNLGREKGKKDKISFTFMHR